MSVGKAIGITAAVVGGVGAVGGGIYGLYRLGSKGHSISDVSRDMISRNDHNRDGMVNLNAPAENRLITPFDERMSSVSGGGARTYVQTDYAVLKSADVLGDNNGFATQAELSARLASFDRNDNGRLNGGDRDLATATFGYDPVHAAGSTSSSGESVDVRVFESFVEGINATA